MCYEIPYDFHADTTTVFLTSSSFKNPPWLLHREETQTDVYNYGNYFNCGKPQSNEVMKVNNLLYFCAFTLGLSSEDI